MKLLTGKYTRRVAEASCVASSNAELVVTRSRLIKFWSGIGIKPKRCFSSHHEGKEGQVNSGKISTRQFD